MPIQYNPVFIESITDGIENGAWMHEDANISTLIIPRAYTSDLGFLRLRVNELHHATEILREDGFTVSQKSGAIEVAPTGSQDLNNILKLFKEHGIYVELTAIIPGIYQG
jgi:hypothetical protein